MNKTKIGIFLFSAITDRAHFLWREKVEQQAGTERSPDRQPK